MVARSAVWKLQVPSRASRGVDVFLTTFSDTSVQKRVDGPGMTRNGRKLRTSVCHVCRPATLIGK
jgi:hypothetical protein